MADRTSIRAIIAIDSNCLLILEHLNLKKAYQAEYYSTESTVYISKPTCSVFRFKHASPPPDMGHLKLKLYCNHSLV